MIPGSFTLVRSVVQQPFIFNLFYSIAATLQLNNFYSYIVIFASLNFSAVRVGDAEDVAASPSKTFLGKIG